MSIVLREIIPDGSQWGTLGEILTDWSDLEFGQDLKDASSISFSYPKKGRHSNKIKSGMYVAPVVNGDYKWDNSYFYVRDDEGSLTAGTAKDSVKVAGISLRGRLDKVKWMPAFGSSYMDSNLFKYINVSPGTIIKAGVENYWSRAKSRFNSPVNWLVGVDEIALPSKPYKVDEIIEGNTSIQDMITKYQDLGIATAKFSGFKLVVYPYYGIVDRDSSLDKSSTVQLSVGVNLREGSYTTSVRDLVTSLLVIGGQDMMRVDSSDSVAVLWVTAPASTIAELGYHEDTLTVSSAANPETLKAIGENYLSRYSKIRESRTYSLVDNLIEGSTGSALPLPKALTDFQCGDSISILTSRGVDVDVVYSLTFSCLSPNNVTLGITLGDYFDEWETTFEQRLKRLEQGR